MIDLSDEARRLVASYEEAAGVTVRDCVVDDEHDQVIFLVAAGELHAAIGPGGDVVERFQERLGRDVKLVEDAATPAAFVANALAPAAVYNVTVSENGDTVAYAEVAEEDRGVAIGPGGKNIDAARRLASRNFDVDGIELT